LKKEKKRKVLVNIWWSPTCCSFDFSQRWVMLAERERRTGEEGRRSS
jgi:hypothetical protein